MAWLSNFAGSSGIPVLVTVLLILVGVFFAVKYGFISFQGKGLRVGTADSESKIRNMQQLFAHSLFESTLADLPKECEYYRSRFIISQCLDEVERMIRENHITSDDTYIETEYTILYSIVKKYSELEYFRTPQFEEYLHKLVEKLVKQLERIRKTYGEL